MKALVMCGGKGERFSLFEEKLLSQYRGNPIIKHVVDTLIGSDKIEKVFLLVSDNSPNTKEYLINEYGPNKNISIIRTSGIGFIEDMVCAVNEKKLFEPLLIVSGDLPLISRSIILDILELYRKVNKPALSLMIPKKLMKEFSVTSYFIHNGIEVVPLGINIIDGKLINGPMEEEIIILENIREYPNINTKKDLDILNRSY